MQQQYNIQPEKNTLKIKYATKENISYRQSWYSNAATDSHTVSTENNTSGDAMKFAFQPSNFCRETFEPSWRHCAVCCNVIRCSPLILDFGPIAK